MNSKNISMSDQIDQENCDNPSMMEKFTGLKSY